MTIDRISRLSKRIEIAVSHIDETSSYQAKKLSWILLASAAAESNQIAAHLRKENIELREALEMFRAEHLQPEVMQ